MRPSRPRRAAEDAGRGGTIFFARQAWSLPRLRHPGREAACARSESLHTPPSPPFPGPEATAAAKPGLHTGRLCCNQREQMNCRENATGVQKQQQKNPPPTLTIERKRFKNRIQAKHKRVFCWGVKDPRGASGKKAKGLLRN